MKGTSKKAGTAGIVWFKPTDLRLRDHGPLWKANTVHDSVLNIFVFDVRQFGKTAFGFPKCGVHRSRFLKESVDDLRKVSP